MFPFFENFFFPSVDGIYIAELVFNDNVLNIENVEPVTLIPKTKKFQEDLIEVLEFIKEDFNFCDIHGFFLLFFFFFSQFFL